GPTWTANLITLFEQVTIGFFSLQLVVGLTGAWGAEAPTRAQRVAVIWASAFAPYLAWRLAYGHDNLVLGLLPLVVAAGLVARARSETPSPLAIAFGAWAVWNGLSALGAQLVVYGIVFGAPLLACLALEGTERPRWSRAQLAIALALASAALLVLPRMAGMLARVASDDFPRTDHLVYSFGGLELGDWLASLPWTAAGASSSSALGLHEANVPIGPLALLLVAWPAAARRRIPIALGTVAVVCVLFASGIPPGSWLAELPGLSAFRVPSRALLVVLVLLPPIALAAAIARGVRPSARADLAALLAGALVAVAARFAGSVACEVLAVLVIAAIAFSRWRPDGPARHAIALVPVLAALSLAAFDERFPRHVVHDRIEAGPAELHDELVAAEPELASPLVRIAITQPSRPFEMSTAFAAGLGSLDGAWFPTRRFLTLLSVLAGTPVDSTTGVFALSSSRAFPVLQQLYNVRYALQPKGTQVELSRLAPTPGPAWFPATVASIDTAAQLAGASLDTAWVLRADRADPPPGCASGTVTSATVDARGQEASFVIDSPGRCTLVVAASYVHTLRASITSAPPSAALRGPAEPGLAIGNAELPVFPVDLALVGIEVPPGTATVVLGPVAVRPPWAIAGFYLGIALLVAAIASSSLTARQP
ncbi:MAG: hypothetical protein JNL83_15385, partial [Myxococcales bacterium]|nr:hypothetical protein [Myxococcales bacterium]